MIARTTTPGNSYTNLVTQYTLDISIHHMVNIFYTDKDPVKAARDSCDSYVVKIPIEVALLLSAIHWRTGYDGPVSSGVPVVIVNGEVVPAAGPYRVIKWHTAAN